MPTASTNAPPNLLFAASYDVNDVSLIEAWKIWLSGDLSSHAVLWGISIFWWERIGKIMQVLGAATIIADIVGPDKIRSFGSSLQTTIMPIALIEFLRQCFDWYVVIFSKTILKDFVSEVPKNKLERKYSQLDWLNHAICFLLTVAIVVLAELYLAGWAFLIEFVVIYACVLISIAPLFTVLTVISLTLLGLAINTALIKPLAWALEHPSLDRFTKIASLLLLLLGFHFELLAS